MSKHTPGPWKFCMYDHDTHKLKEVPFDYDPNRYWDNPGIYGADDFYIVGCDEYHVFNNANDVRLMCSAPELLALLERWLADTDAYPADDNLMDDTKAAIFKAIGK